MFNSFVIKKKRPNLTGKFLGRVVQSFDEKGCNRVKVKLFGLTDELPVDSLPYYRVATATNDSPNTTINIPPVNSKVEVLLQGEIGRAHV